MLLLRDLLKRLPDWDTPSKLSLGIAVMLLVITLLTAAFGSEAVRLPAMAVAVGLVMIMQVIILWGNRGMVTAFTRAQRHYLAGEFPQARDVLENEFEQGKPTAQTLTLLGNVYRQLGELDRSKAVLAEALILEPMGHFPLYGLGMTLLAQGQYNEAIVRIRQSLSNGGPTVVQFDLGHSLYRAGQWDAAKQVLLEASDVVLEEPHRQLMHTHLLHQLGAGVPPNSQLIMSGLPFWQASAERFNTTDYGKAVQADIQLLLRQVQKDESLS